MIEPKEIEIDGKKYIISKFPAIAGREIVAKYPMTALPKVGDYQLNEEAMLKLMSYVAIEIKDGHKINLITKALIDSHVTSWEVLAKLEIAMMQYNVSFFPQGRISTFFEDTARSVLAKTSKILTAFLEQLSPKEKPPSPNSEPPLV